jgi:arylsulfate sulfotransferase
MRLIRFASFALSLSALAVLAGCGSSSTTAPAPTLSLTPGTAAVGAGQTAQFTATTNFSTGLEQWSVNGVVNGNATVGTITSSGLYTAPTGATGQTVTVSVLDLASPSTMASAQVSVVGAGVVNTTANGQVASYTINLPSAGSVVVNFGPTTTYGRSTWSVNSPSNGGPTTVLVAGMTAAPANNTFHMQAVVTMGSTTVTDADHTFTTTPSIPVAQQPTITATTSAGQSPQQGVEMLSDLAYGALVYDLSGNLLWGYKPADVTAAANVQPAKLLPDGNVLVQIAPLSTYAPGSLPDGTTIEVREVDLTGATVRSLDLPTLQAQLNANGYTNPTTGVTPSLIDMHHDVTLNTTTGHWLILSNYTQSITLTGASSPTTVLGDIILDVDPNNNFQVDWVFDEFNVLDPNRAPLGNTDWTHSNAIVYSPTDHNILVSMRNQNWVIKVNYNDGSGDSSLVWTLGYQGSFQLLNPDGSDDSANPQDWQYAQHEPSFPDLTNTAGTNYNVTLMDDGDDRTFGSGFTCPVALSNGQCLYSRAPIYTINETALTATVSNGVPAPYYTFFGGSANVLANGDEEADYCATGQVLETIPSNTSPTLVWQMTETGTIYRAHRLGSFYPNVQWTQ